MGAREVSRSFILRNWSMQMRRRGCFTAVCASDVKMTEEEQDRVIEIVFGCYQ